MNGNLTIAMILFFCIPAIGSAQAAEKYYTAVTNSNVRAAPTTNSHKIGLLTAGKRVRVIGSGAGGNWHQVRLDSGQMGFVYGKLLLADDSGDSSSSKPDLVGGPTPAPTDAFSYIVWPTDGEVIPGGDFVVLFGLHGMGTAPAGVDKAYTGHHHLLIDTDLPPLDKPIPNDDNNVHFGRGQTEYQIRLPPGTHTLQLLLGDTDHIPHTPPVMSEKITVRVP
jgi:uncharacterized protein YgiM (DUF1202 family)